MRITAARLRGGGIDSRGRRTGQTDSLVFTAWFAPGVSTEDFAHRTETSTMATLYTHTRNLDIEDTDVVTTDFPVAGRWHVDGTPQTWGSPYGTSLGGLVIQLKTQDG